MVRVAVAFSGGIDSTIAAIILKREGNEVKAFTMEVLPSSEQQSVITSQARNVAEMIGIPFEAVPLYEDFSYRVMDYFCEEYKRGRTPNPCVRCNCYVKFGALLEYVTNQGFDYFASGHYARITKEPSGYTLRVGVDKTKDQSYFLHMLNQRQLSQMIMPLGNYKKSKVRQIASESDISLGDKKESQEICFIANNDYKRFIEERTGHGGMPGPILDKNGNELGKHKGLIHYTIGQRRGIGLSSPEPLYVVNIDLDKNAIVVGEKHHIYRSEFIADQINWIIYPPTSDVLEVTAKIRYSQKAENALLHITDKSCARVVFLRSQMAVTPGQSVVFYQGDVVLGGGVIQ